MKKLSVILSVALALSFMFVLSSLAATSSESGRGSSSGAYGTSPGTSTPGTGSTAGTEATTGTMSGEQNMIRSSKLLGMKLESRQGEDLGKIQDLVVDPQSGRIIFAILSTGGIAGIGSKMHAVPFTMFSASGTERDKMVVDISKDQFEKAPAFKDQDITNRAWGEEVYRYYGQRPHWMEQGTGSMSPGPSGSPPPGSPTR